MQVQVNTDASISASKALEQRVEGAVRDGLARFAERLSRAEVHLSDVNSGARSGEADMLCTLEVRMHGRDPQAVEHKAPSIDLATKGAVEKMARALSSTVGKLAARTHPRPQAGHDPSPDDSVESPDSPDSPEPPDSSSPARHS